MKEKDDLSTNRDRESSQLKRHITMAASSSSPSSSSLSSSAPPKASKDGDSTLPPHNIFRDSPLRYLGYANEVGESFRYQYPRWVMPSYVLAFGYCFADTCTTGYDTYNTTQKTVPTAVSTMDVMLWQSLASVGIPGMTINLIVRSSRFALARTPMAVPAMAAKWMPTFVGLASIPFIIHPIDTVVDHFMDATYRSWTGQLLTKEVEDITTKVDRREE